MSSDSTLEDLIALCLEAERLGVPIDHASLISAYPEHAAELGDFLSAHAGLRRLTAQIGSGENGQHEAAPPLPVAGNSDESAATLLESGFRRETDEILRLGSYRLIRELGRGGMGVVYEAWQEGVNRPVAVKVVSAGPFASAEELKRFRTEAEAAANLSHPGLVPIYEVGAWEGRPFYSMELVSGQSLADVASTGPLQAEKAAVIVAEVADAVDYAHSHGILHRDLKPANVLIDNRQRPRVLDFGLAKRLNSATGNETAAETFTRTGAILGTPSFMAPEQALGLRAVGPAADVYGLGAILYFLLTGRPPFKGSTSVETLSLVIEGRLEPVRNLNGEVPAELATIVETCLEKDPHDRYRSAADMAADLRRYLSGEPIRAGGLSLWGRLARAVGQSRHVAHFRQWGKTIIGFGLAIFVAHFAMQFLVWNGHDDWLTMFVPRLVMFAAMLIMLRLSREGTLMPRDAVERLVWVVWTAYLLGYAAIAFVTWIADRNHVSVYAYAAALAGVAFFTLGCHVWGACYLVGLAFFVAAPLLATTPDHAILIFGALWGLSLCALGLRYEWLNRTLPVDE